MSNLPITISYMVNRPRQICRGIRRERIFTMVVQLLLYRLHLCRPTTITLKDISIVALYAELVIMLNT